MNYESCRKVGAFRSIMAHFKRENMSQVIYYNNRQCKLYNTLIYRYIFLWPKYVINTLTSENTFIKHYTDIVSSGYLLEEQKGINCSPQVCLHNHHPEAKQHTAISTQCCWRREAHHPKQDNNNLWEGKTISLIQSGLFAETRQCSTPTEHQWTPPHHNYLLLQ